MYYRTSHRDENGAVMISEKHFDTDDLAVKAFKKKKVEALRSQTRRERFHMPERIQKVERREVVVDLTPGPTRVDSDRG